MKRKLIIHIGMSKTGSSSIQQSFGSNEIKMGDDWQYLDLEDPNHSILLYTVFSSCPEEYYVYATQNKTAVEVEDIRRNYRDVLVRSIESSSAKNVIVSGEDLSSLDYDAVVNLKIFFSRYFDSFLIIGYVRPPIGFMQSIFQQMLKAGIQSFDFEKMWPSYRFFFEKFDSVFGRDNVLLVRFDKSVLHKNDVLLDFGCRLGLDINPGVVKRSNESLTLEATALLYLYRIYGSGYGVYPGAVRDNNLLISFLSCLGVNSLKFDRSLLLPVVEKRRTDIDWIENRLGEVILDIDKLSDEGIKSEADLIGQAMESVPLLMELMGREYLKLTPENVACFIGEIRKAVTGRVYPGIEKKMYDDFFSKAQLDVIECPDAKPADILRELAVSLHKASYNEAAIKVIEHALKLRPQGPGIIAIHKRMING